MRKVFKIALIATGMIAAPQLSHAFEKLDGYFMATGVCEAYQAKNRQTNPGNIETELERAYPIKGINKVGGDYFQIVIEGVPVTTDRWVHVTCGKHLVEAGTATASTDGDSTQPVTPVPTGESTENLLALSWQPAFCEYKPNKTECRNLNDGLLPHTEQQWSIHGLWPQPRTNIYCGVSQAVKDLDKPETWDQLPDYGADADTAEELAVAMPGVASGLDRHEWIKHGTCYRGEGGGDEYYDDTLWLTDQINQSAIGDLLRSHLGAELETQRIRDAFDEAFGPGAGERVQIECRGDGDRVLIRELKINLSGTISPSANMLSLLLSAPTQSLGCPRGVVDPVGLQ